VGRLKYEQSGRDLPGFSTEANGSPARLGDFGFEMMDSVPRNLTEKEAAGMTVNERLWVSGLLAEFDAAVERRDEVKVSEILTMVFLDQLSIDAIIGSQFGKE